MPINTEPLCDPLEIARGYGYHKIGEQVGGVNTVALLASSPDSTEPEAVLKVPHDKNWRELWTSVYLDEISHRTEESPGLVLPSLIDSRSEPMYLILEYVPGEVLRQEDTALLTLTEQQGIGATLGRFAAWGARNFDPDLFRETVDRRCSRLQDWDLIFRTVLHDVSLDLLEPYPTLTEIFHRTRALWNQHYPDWFDSYNTQPIHGDLRLPNIALSGEPGLRQPSGIFDFGTMRLGSTAEEARSLHLLDPVALGAYNDALEDTSIEPVAPDAIKFWFEGRFFIGLVGGITPATRNPEMANYCARMFQKLYPNEDWSELEQLEQI